MIDPFGNMKNMIGQFQQFMGNPMQFLAQRNLNIPQEYMNDPSAAIQYLMNSGKLTQEQFTWAQNMASQVSQNPIFRQMFGNR